MGQVNLSKLNASTLLKYSEKPELDPVFRLGQGLARAARRADGHRRHRRPPLSGCSVAGAVLLLGCDFSSAPSRAQADRAGARPCARRAASALSRLERFDSLDAWRRWLADHARLDRRLRLSLRPAARAGRAPGLAAAVAAADRALRRPRPRRDPRRPSRPSARRGRWAASSRTAPPMRPAGSSPSMKWVNPPVAFMLHAGVPRLLEAGAALPGLHVPAALRTRVALEGYPGLLARELIGRRSYKSDEAALRQTPRRERARRPARRARRRRHAPGPAAGARRMPSASAAGRCAAATASTRRCAWCRPPGARRASERRPGLRPARGAWTRWKAGSSPPEVRYSRSGRRSRAAPWSLARLVRRSGSDAHPSEIVMITSISTRSRLGS